MPVPTATSLPNLGYLMIGNDLVSRSNQQTNNGCEQGNGLNQSGNNQHGSLDTTSRFRLTGNTFHGTTTNFTNTQTSTNSR